MKLIILKDIKGLAKRGEIKEVSDGYARNFLLPKNLAEIATAENIAKLQESRQQQVKMAKKDLLATEKLASRLEGRAIEIQGKANLEGRFYAAINASAIARKLKEQGFDVKKDQIKLIEQIKEPGEYPVSVNLDHGLEAEVTVLAVGN